MTWIYYNQWPICLHQKTNQRKTTSQRQIYFKQFHIICIYSVIGLTLLSLYRLASSSTLQPPVFFGNEKITEHVEWRDFVADYEKLFHRGPPPDGFDAWFKFATKNQCETRRFYESLDDDLAYFRNNNNKSSSLLQWDEVIPQGLTMTDNYIAFELENHKLKIVSYQTEKQHEKAVLRLLKWLLKPIIHHSPPLSSKFIFNLYDLATEKSVKATYPIFSVCKMDYYTDHQPPPPPSLLLTTSEQEQHNETAVQHNDLLLQAYAADLFSKQPKEPQLPGTNNQDADVFVQSKDLLVPWHFSLRFISQQLWWWPFYQRNGAVPYRRRKNQISWRGSTTGPWETGARFKLVKEYGGRGIHPLWSSSNNSSTSLHDNTNNNNNNTTTTTGGGDSVNADFAFIKVVQKPQDTKRVSPEEYRFARHMFYREMQQNKYVLDIDGNGFSSRFPGLLRSGTLVFKSTRYREWLHGRLLPYVDYIPVNYDLTDLVGKLQWVNNNDNNQQHLAERIVQHSRQQVEQLFRPVEMQCYMYRLLLEYQTLFEKPPSSS